VTRVAAIAALVCLTLVPAAAGTSVAHHPPIALTASPSHLTLVGTGRTTIRVTNFGARAVVLDLTRAGFSIDLRGRPRVVARGDARAAVSWLTLRPRSLALHPGGSGLLTVSARVPPRAEPGDHDALVLMTTRPRRTGGLAVRMRMGVVVVVRAPGRIVRRLQLRGLRVRRTTKRMRVLELMVVNRGNVTEALDRGQLVVSFGYGGRIVRLRPEARELRPRTSGIVQLPYRGPIRGWVTVRAQISFGSHREVRRAYRIRL